MKVQNGYMSIRVNLAIAHGRVRDDVKNLQWDETTKTNIKKHPGGFFEGTISGVLLDYGNMEHAKKTPG